MRTRYFFMVGLATLLVASTKTTLADVVVTLEARDITGNRIDGPIAPGTQVNVEISFSATGADNPLPDVREFILDFSATSSTIELTQFTWSLQTSAYSVQFNNLPSPAAVSTFSNSNSLLLEFSDLRQVVAMITIAVNGDGTLNSVTRTGTSSEAGAKIQAGFGAVPFTFEDGMITGGTLDFTVTGGGGGPVPGPGPTDPDRDSDGVPDSQDAFPNDASETVDSDGDGVGDNADVFPTDASETTDTDGDGIGDNSDTDADGDGVDNVDDLFPLDPNESADADNDGVGDNSDVFPSDPVESVDTDQDMVGNNADPDDDNDGVADVDDAFPLDPAETMDSDGDGIGDNADIGGNDANSGPRIGGSLCGMGMIASLAMILCGLLGFRIRPRRGVVR